ncbi:MAG: NAD-dependent epimerase/dehydratase family protein, partial [Pseudomonadota bacterium]|nr:NAD-dependent epimerase/dehydratase family protein [Pseudomonadota bacterium]
MTTTSAPFNRLLLTGAAGGLGKVLRESLRPYTNVLRLSDIADIAPARDEHEEVVICDLADKQAVHQLVEGVDAILH